LVFAAVEKRVTRKQSSFSKRAIAREWVWGQFAAFLPIEDYVWIVQTATKKSWISLADGL